MDADVTVNVAQVPDDLMQQVLGQWPPGLIRQMTRFARSDHLSVFDTPMAESLRRRGLFPSVVTSVVSPGNGAAVSGTTLLDATNIYDDPGTTVEFRLSGGAEHDAPIGRATGTVDGYVLLWDTTSVVDGFYRLSSEVVRPGGAIDRSDPIWIHVVNRGRGT